MGLFLGFLSCSIGLCFCFLCQYHTVLMTVALCYNLKSEKLIPPALSFLKMTLVFQGLLCFHMIFIFNCRIMKRRLLLGRKVMTNLDSILKSRDITLPTKVCLVKAMVFPVVMYGWESWTIKKAEHQRTDAFELWCWRRLLRVPWTARRSNPSILKEMGVHWKDWCWSWNSNTLATWCEELTYLKKPYCWERLRAGGEGDDRG